MPTSWDKERVQRQVQEKRQALTEQQVESDDEGAAQKQRADSWHQRVVDPIEKLIVVAVIAGVITWASIAYYGRGESTAPDPSAPQCFEYEGQTVYCKGEGSDARYDCYLDWSAVRNALQEAGRDDLVPALTC